MAIPAWLHHYLEQNIQAAVPVANQPYQPFQGHVPAHVGRRFAPMSPLEHQAERLAAQTGAANPFVRQAEQLGREGSRTFPEQMEGYMNPYQQAVLDRIQRQGNRNLNENILPALEARFTRLGQHGGSRHADLSARAARDIQDEISGRQAESLERGFGHAMQGFNWDKARKMEEAQLQAHLGQMMAANRLAELEGLQKQGLIGRELHERPMRAAESEHHMMQMDPQQRRQFLTNVLHGVPFNEMQDNPRSMHRRNWQNLGMGMGARAAAGAGRAAMPHILRGLGLGGGHSAAGNLFARGGHV